VYSRREFGRVALAGLPLSAAVAAAKIDDKVNGVKIGCCSYSFRDRPLDAAIKGMVEDGIGLCELSAMSHVELNSLGSRAGARGGDPVAAREALRKWRLTVPLSEFKAVRKKFDDAGIQLFAYSLNMNDSFTDEEIDRGFEMAKTLGVEVMTMSATLSSAKRIAPFADKHKFMVAMHNHANVNDPNQFAKPEAFVAACAMSKYFRIELDIGHFVAANYDPVAYIAKEHARIRVLHFKDRKKNQGENYPWGQGDTPIKEVLQLLKKNKWPIPCDIEYEYKGTEDATIEVAKCLQYMKDALA
jgi:sugar phosphate isomerase/epimerase